MTSDSKKRPAFNRSIRLQLLTGTVVILVAVVLLLTTLISRNASSLLERQTGNQVTQLAGQSARTVRDFLDARAATVDVWAVDTLLLSVVRDPGLSAVFLPGLERYIGKYAIREPWIDNVLLLSDDALIFALEDLEGWRDRTALLAQLTQAAGQESRLFELDGAHRLAITRQAIDRGISVPGVHVVLLIDPQVIQDLILAETSPGPNGLAALYGPTGVPVVDVTGPAIAIADLADGPRTIRNDTYLIETRPVIGSPLHAVVVAAHADIDAPVRRLVLVSVVMGLGAILLGLAAMAFFASRVTAPIRQLSSTAREEALVRFGPADEAGSAPAPRGRGRFSRVLKSARAPYGADEVGELAAVFDLLGRTTDELTEANALLESRNIELDESRSLLRSNLSRLQRELDGARTLQLSMVPRPEAVLGQGDTVQIQALMEPAREVGGDFYDYFAVNDRTVCAMIGDVSDKGTPSALFMARTLSLLRYSVSEAMRQSGEVPGPADVLAKVNAELCKANRTRMFVTLLLCFFDTKDGTVTCANAGHVVPFRIGRGPPRRLDMRYPDLPLGVTPKAAYEAETHRLQPGEGLVMFTDGVTEAENDAFEQFGTDRLARALDRAGGGRPSDSVAAIRAAIDDFAGGAEQFDDITLLVLGWRPIGSDRAAS